MLLNKTSLALIFASILTHQAVAADLLVTEDEAVEAPPAVYTGDWNGFYLGAYGGYNWVSTGISGSSDVDAEGLNGGIYTGYNHQFDNNLLLGIEADAGLGDIEDANGGTRINQEWDASLRGRMGYAFERSLFYGFAGLGVTSLQASTLAGSDTNTLTGWNLGAGFETFLTDNLTARLEYGFADYSEENFNLGGAGTTSIDLQDQGIVLGLGLKF